MKEPLSLSLFYHMTHSLSKNGEGMDMSGGIGHRLSQNSVLSTLAQRRENGEEIVTQLQSRT